MMKFTIAIMGISFLLGLHNQSFAAAKKPAAKKPVTTSASSKNAKSCIDEKAEFKRLYIELQNSLNYEGKDAFLDKKGALQLKAHTGSTYEGKVFEEALFREYQNSLRKVAQMYQAAKFDSASTPEFKTNKALVDFIKAVDVGGDEAAKYIAGNDVNKVIDELQKASNSKYPAGSKSIITDNDKYLLQKLLTHSQDLLCSIEKFQETGKRDRNFTKELLEKKKNAPLNQLLLAVKDAKLTKDSDIKLEEIPDEKAAINSAIASNMKKLNDWAKNNKNCVAAVKESGFMNSIQAGIQSCNYRKFVDALDGPNVTNIEQILHFINSNEKFLKGAQTKAETSMDEMKLQAYVDRTFANLGNKINCTEVVNQTTANKRLFVRNLPYLDAQNKFDTSKISCKIKTPASKKGPASERTLSEKECSSKILLISDELGRGIEVKQKNTKEAAISFSITDNPDCSEIALAVAPDDVPPVQPQVADPPAAALTNDMCVAQGMKETPPKPMIITIILEKSSCIVGPYTNAWCSSWGKTTTPATDKVANKDNTGCEDAPVLIVETEKSCADKNMGFDAEKKVCIPKVEVETEKSCADKNMGFDAEEKVCIPKVEVETEKSCADKNMGFDAEKKACIPKAETEKTCADKNMGFDAEKKACVEKKKEEKKEEAKIDEESDAEKACKAKNTALSKDESERPITQFEFKNGVCIDKKFKERKSVDTEFEDDTKAAPSNGKFVTPGRFTPVNIPTRQMYILPGMI